MMIKPGITELSKCVDSRYTLVTMAAKRARMVGREQNSAEVYDAKADKPVTVAVTEIANRRVGYVRSEDAKKAQEFEEEKLAAIMSMNESYSMPQSHEAYEAVEENRDEAAELAESLEANEAAEGTEL